MTFVRVSLFPLLVLAACAREDPATATAESAPAWKPPPLEISKDSKGLLFSYMLPNGQMGSTESLGAVPAEAREQVVVFDLGRSPAERGSAEVVYLADLREPDATGRYKWRAVSRMSFDRQVLSESFRRAMEDRLGDRANLVTVYSTSWCGVCSTLKRYLADKGVKYVDKDIEKDSDAAMELQYKAQMAKLDVRGVPVSDVYGEMVSGFDAAYFDQLLAKGPK